MSIKVGIFRKVMLVSLIVVFGYAADVMAGGGGGATPGIQVNGDLTISNAGRLVFPDGTVQMTAGVPSWHQILPAAQRFQLVMLNGGVYEAVLDSETGLVWEKAPSASTANWATAMDGCYALDLGGRSGWRLPSITELASLMDKSVAGTPKLPAGHPFTNIQTGRYWTVTAANSLLNGRWLIDITWGQMYTQAESGINLLWCVRGGQ